MATKEICACTTCQCEVKAHESLARNGHLYCGEDCANGHASQKGCGHDACAC